MPYGRASLYDDEDELPESDDQLIMNVLNGLGIQERPDIDRGTSNCINNISSARSSYTAVDETSPKRCSVAFSEVSDGWTIVSRSINAISLYLIRSSTTPRASRLCFYSAPTVFALLLQYTNQILLQLNDFF